MARGQRPHRGRLTQDWQTQCECTATAPGGEMCSCTDWFTIKAGKPHPNVPCCSSCLSGKHKD